MRRDLRTRDNLALWSACRDAGEVIPLFISDDFLLKGSSAAKKMVIMDDIISLDQGLSKRGGKLFFRSGDPVEVIMKLLAETNASGVYTTRDYEPRISQLQSRLAREVMKSGKVWKIFKDLVIFEGSEIVTKSGAKLYTVFTAYKNAWLLRREEIPPPLPGIRKIKVAEIEKGTLRLPGTRTGLHDKSDFPSGGEGAALMAMRDFLSKKVNSYKETRDFPAVMGTSRLSHHLATGSLGIRTLYNALNKASSGSGGFKSRDAEIFLNQLIWREFYYQILSNYPHVAEGSFKKEYDEIKWSAGGEMFELWSGGLTGYPFVDAAMRQLNSEGWMHNRCRMVVANFLTKDLHIDWRLGEKYFMEKLADGDPALNNGGWQWSAGTGNDSQPWFRIFNPVLQGEKFDPKGEYVRKYVPELRMVPDMYLHAPWKMPLSVQSKSGVLIGKVYPKPLVNHEIERKRTLEIYSNVLK